MHAGIPDCTGRHDPPLPYVFEAGNTGEPALTDPHLVFERHRPRLHGLAYRMLGTVGDAEDILQEAFLRWHRADKSGIRSPEAWLVTAVTRLCIDRLRAAAVERAAYVGPWLPEPLPGMPAEMPDRRLELAADLSMAFLVVLERLTPEERAAFLLRDVFDCGYAEIARALGRSEPTCRQIVHRARERVRRDRPRFTVSPAAHRKLLQRFLTALQTQDQTELVTLFAEDAVLVSDGGGKAWAARNLIRGADRIARLLVGVNRKMALRVGTPDRIDRRVMPLNGEPGIVTFVDGHPVTATALETDGERILSIFRVLNPDKLHRLLDHAPAGEFSTAAHEHAVTNGHAGPSLLAEVGSAGLPTDGEQRCRRD